MIAVLVSIVVSMLDPITAGGGIMTGLLWAKRSAWALLPLFTAFAVIVGLQMASISPRIFYVVVQLLALAVWAGLTYGVSRLWVKQPQAPS